MGVGWNNHRGVLVRNDLSGLTNGGRLSIMMTNGCSAGAYDSSDCVVEHFVMAPEGGGVAAYANSRTGLLSRSDPLHGQSFMQIEGILSAWFGHPRQARLGDLIDVQARVAPLADTSARYRWSHYQWTLYGEPAMPVWIPEQTAVEESPTDVGVSRYHGPTVVAGMLRHPYEEPAVLIDITGRRVMRLERGGNDVSGVPPGVYFVRAEHDNARTLSRIVIAGEE